MLFITNLCIPSKAFGQASSRHEIVSAELKISKQLLQLVGDTVVFVAMKVLVIAERVDELSELRCHV